MLSSRLSTESLFVFAYCAEPFIVEVVVSRSSVVSYSIALFWLRRKLRRLRNLSVLSTVLFSALTSLAHSFFILAGSFLSIMLIELVVVISLSNPGLFRSLYPSSTVSTNFMNLLFFPSLMGLMS